MLHNLDSGVITCSKDAIKFFNENGKKLIDQAIANQDESPEKQECLLEVDDINQKICKLQPTNTDCTKKRETQAKILSKPLFKEYFRGKKDDEQNGQEFSLQQLLEIDRSEICKKVFIQIANQQNEGTQTKKYVSISISRLTNFDQEMILLKFSDMTMSI